MKEVQKFYVVASMNFSPGNGLWQHHGYHETQQWISFIYTTYDTYVDPYHETHQYVLLRNGLMLLWFTDLMNVTEGVTIHRPNVSTLLPSAFTRGDLNATTRGPFI